MVVVVLVCLWSDGCRDDESAQIAEMLRQDAGCGDQSYDNNDRRPLVVLVLVGVGCWGECRGGEASNRGQFVSNVASK